MTKPPVNQRHLPVSDNATITMPLPDFRRAEKEYDRAMREGNPHLGVADLPPELEKIQDALQNALRIVGFAVGNLNPESVYNWPHRAVDALGAFLKESPNPELQTQGIELCAFAKECAEIAIFRSKRRAAAEAYLQQGGAAGDSVVVDHETQESVSESTKGLTSDSESVESSA